MLDLALSNKQNQKLQELCVSFLIKWWNLHHPLSSETPCQMDDNRKNVLVKLTRLMNSHSPVVKEYDL